MFCLSGDVTMESDHALCPHCGGQSVRTLLLYGQQASYRCRDCAGYFNHVAQQTNGLYDHDYYTRNYEPRRAEQLKKSREHAALISRFASSGSVLDYGCGSGVFLEALAEEGFIDNVGADVSEDALQFVLRRQGDCVTTVQLGVESIPDRRFQIISLMDSISHIPNLRDVMVELVDRHLADDGVVVVRTPDIVPTYFHIVCALVPMIGAKRASNLMFANARYVLFERASIRRYLESLHLQVVHEELIPDYRPLFTGGSPLALMRTLSLRVLNAQVKTVFVIAKRTNAG